MVKTDHDHPAHSEHGGPLRRNEDMAVPTAGTGVEPRLFNETDPESTGLSGLPVHDLLPDELLPAAPSPKDGPAKSRVVLIRHGQPDIALRPRTSRAGFHAYIDAYEAAGLHPHSQPPGELMTLLGEIREATDSIFVSNRPRALGSAGRLFPRAEKIIDAAFAEAPLAAPPLPLVRLTVPAWAILGRMVWYAGYHPGIEGPKEAGVRAADAARRLTARAAERGAAVLVAHGYFNFMIGRVLAAQGYKRRGRHRAKYWNTVVYDKG